MSLQVQAAYTVPEETARVAHAIFPDGNPYLQLYDTFGQLFQDQEFAPLFPTDGQPALSPVRLMLVLLLQFAEGLSDRQAADAVRARIDWKYLLCLELTDPGFDASVLSEFRTRLIENQWEQTVLNKLLAQFRERGLLKARGQQRTDSTVVLGAVRDLNRLELVGETLRHALNSLAVAAPDWLRAHSRPDWVERYGARVQNYRLPSGPAPREAYAEMVAADGLALWQSLMDPAAPVWLRQVPAVQILQRVWIQNYTWREDGTLRWRQTDELPPAALAIRSPYDDEARFSQKRETTWVGYKVHVTETCDDETPRLITHVETTLATTADGKVTTAIHAGLQTQNLLPADHIVDTAYLDADLLVTSQQEYGVNLVGPTRQDTGWQARQEGNGFTAQDFTLDWEHEQATCPAGKTSQFWAPGIDNHGNPMIQIKFAKRDCRACSVQLQCTRANPPRRTVTVRPEAQHKALQAARAREKTETFAQQYAKRAGIEGTLSQGVRGFDLRRTRYIGLAKTHLQHILIAGAMNLMRVADWLAEEPLAQAHPSAFVRLHRAAVATA